MTGFFWLQNSTVVEGGATQTNLHTVYGLNTLNQKSGETRFLLKQIFFEGLSLLYVQRHDLYAQVCTTLVKRVKGFKENLV